MTNNFFVASSDFTQNHAMYLTSHAPIFAVYRIVSKIPCLPSSEHALIYSLAPWSEHEVWGQILQDILLSKGFYAVRFRQYIAGNVAYCKTLHCSTSPLTPLIPSLYPHWRVNPPTCIVLPLKTGINVN